MLISGYQPFSLSDFPGKTAAIIFTQGCNFRCPWCHNRQLWPMTAMSSGTIAPEDILAQLQKRAGQLDGLVMTGGEPTLQKGLKSFITRVKGLGYAVKLDTNGSNPDVLADLLAGNLLDFVAMDIKAPPEKYDPLCGIEVDMEAILASIATLSASGLPHLFRTTWEQSMLEENDLEVIRSMIPGSPLLVQNCRSVDTTL